jgi:hypothetical protein
MDKRATLLTVYAVLFNEHQLKRPALVRAMAKHFTAEQARLFHNVNGVDHFITVKFKTSRKATAGAPYSASE